MVSFVVEVEAVVQPLLLACLCSASMLCFLCGADFCAGLLNRNGPLEMDVKKKDRKITVREKIDESVAIKPQVNQDDKLAGQGVC